MEASLELAMAAAAARVAALKSFESARVSMLELKQLRATCRAMMNQIDDFYDQIAVNAGDDLDWDSN